MKPFYSEKGITIYHGDCREILPSLSEPVLFADPPYGVDKAEWDKSFDQEWQLFAAGSCEVMAITPGIVNLLSMARYIGDHSYRWAMSIYIENAIVRGALGFGNWIPVLIYAREGKSIYSCSQDATSIAIRGQMPEHPSPKPFDAMRWILSRLPEGCVIDPFMGSGTTLRAAKDLGRKAIGIEICEKYCEIAARRLSQEVLSFGDEKPEVLRDVQGELL